MNMLSPGGRPRVALIAGPTASGKSALALEMAERDDGTIINADASQVYRDLRVLTARPSAEEEARIPHRLFGHRDGADPFSAAEWAVDAKAAIDIVLGEGRLPILVGGSGLYLRTLLDGIAPIPDIAPDIRRQVRALPVESARAALEAEDAAAAATLGPRDAARIARALEVVRSTGRSILAWRSARTGGIADRIALDPLVLDPPTPDLYRRCDLRAAAIIDEGALEVAALRARHLPPELPVMRAIGVAAIGQWLDGTFSRSDALAILQQDTRRYAKRQKTWARHQFPSAWPRSAGAPPIVPDT